jgi:prophage DNA circulation protein
MAVDCALPVYLDASWKGVPFGIDSSDDRFGRRGEVYEYPLGEITGYKDLGRKARRFKLEGYLIGGNQIALTNAMAAAAESPQPGMLIHPMFGAQLVACVELTCKAEYKTEIRRTKLSFEFVEALPSLAPYIAGAAISAVFDAGSNAINASVASATWVPTLAATEAATRTSSSLADRIAPAIDEESFDAISMLERGLESAGTKFTRAPSATPQLGSPVAAVASAAAPVYASFADVVGPMDNGTATVRRIHTDAMARLRAWNQTLVGEDVTNRSIESMIVSARLSLIRDYALTAAQTTYATVRDAINDLDFVMAVYDEEEAVAVQRCDDVLATAIRTARATAAQTILVENITLPGIAQSSADGVWPSLVVAHKLYFDGRRYGDVESYNPHMSPFFVGRTVVAPAA